MRRMAAELGCTVMTVYKYFPRKIDILQALWTLVFRTLFDELDERARQQPDAITRLEVVATGYVRFWLERRDHYFLVFMSSNVEQSDVSIYVQDDELIGRFAIFQTGISQACTARLTEPEIKLRAELLLCSLNGIAHNLITISGFPWTEPAALVQAAVRAAIQPNPCA